MSNRNPYFARGCITRTRRRSWVTCRCKLKSEIVYMMSESDFPIENVTLSEIGKHEGVCVYIVSIRIYGFGVFDC